MGNLRRLAAERKREPHHLVVTAIDTAQGGIHLTVQDPHELLAPGGTLVLTPDAVAALPAALYRVLAERERA